MRPQIAIALGLAAVTAHAATPPPVNASVATLLERARLWDDRNNPQQAREALQKLFRIAPDHPDGLAALAMIEARAERPVMAKAALDKLRRVQPGHPVIPSVELQLRLTGPDRQKLVEARQLAQQSRLDGRRDQRPKALAAYRALFRGARPEGDLALEYWQLVAEDWDSWNQAQDGLADLVKRHPDSLRYRYALAEHETARLPMNTRALQTIIDMTRLPGFERQARAAWRRAMLRLEPAPETAGMIEAYLEREPSDSLVREHLKTQLAALETRRHQPAPVIAATPVPSEGLVLLDKGDLAAAELQLERELRTHPDDADILGGIGLLRLRQGHHAQALAYFEQARRKQPEQAARWQSMSDTARFWGLLREAADARSGREFALAEDKLREAMAINPREPQALVSLARVQGDRQRIDAAEASYRRALEVEPENRAALGELLELLVRSGRREEARQMIAALTPAQRSALGRDADAIEAGMLRAEADGLIAAGKPDEAAVLLEAAIRLDADDPWLRYSLGRLYLARKETVRGMALFDELLVRHPGDPGTLYAKALLQSSAEQELQALATLEQIVSAQRDVKLTRFQRELWLGLRLAQVRATQAAGRTEMARLLLDETGQILGADVELMPRLALAWADAGDALRALTLFTELRRNQPNLPPEVLLAEAEILATLGQLNAMRGIVASLPAPFAATQAERLLRLKERAALQATRNSTEQGDLQAAQDILSAAIAELGEQPDLLRALATLELSRGQTAGAESTLRRLLARQPDAIPARTDLVRLLLQAGHADAATLIEETIAMAANGELPGLIAFADLLVEKGRHEAAQRLLDRLRERATDSARLQLLTGQLAQAAGRHDDALIAMQLSYTLEQKENMARSGKQPSTLKAQQSTGTAAVDLEIAGPAAATPSPESAVVSSSYGLKQIAVQIDQRANWVSAGYDRRERIGTSGYSSFQSDEVAAEAILPLANGERWFVRSDAVRLNAGRLDPTRPEDARSFGSMALCVDAPAGCPSAGRQTAEGVGLALGWIGQNRRIDLGLTPQNFAVSNWVGGLIEKGNLGSFSWSADLSRRAITSSLLSWAGTRDPNTGRIWGGVVASGLRLGLSHDQGGALGFWSSLGLHALTGKNVQDNQRAQLMAGGYWRVVNEDNHQLSVGLTGMKWRFEKNVGEYTLGHGGYYSPGSYQSLAIPVTWTQRFVRFSYVMRAAASISQARTDGALYYPGDPALQAAAIARGIDPRYAATPDNAPSSRGWSFHMGWEYQLDPQIFLGGRVEIERSPDYAPDRYLLYFRYNLDRPAAQPVGLSPEAFVPYSQY